MALASLNPVEEELKRTIGRLNDTFELNLRQPDPTLSPSRRRSQTRTEEERRLVVIYDRIRVLHYKNDPRLAECLGRFHGEAEELLKQVQPRGENWRVSVPDDVRASLHKCLLQALPDIDEIRRPKRLSDDLPGTVSKRTRSRTSKDAAKPSEALDAIPVRSKVRPLEQVNSHTSFDSMPSFSASRLTNSSPRSNVSRVFSDANGGARLLDSQTSIETEFAEKPIHESYPPSMQELQVVTESFSELESRSNASLCVSIHGSTEHWQLGASPYLDAYDETEYSTIAGIEDLDPDPTPHSPSSEKWLTLEDRLKGVWPKFPNTPGLNEAPLAVLWEVTRAAIDCGVDLHHSNLKYESSETWHNQSKMRSQLLRDPAFVGKGLPPSSDAKAWEVAMDKFQTPEKAVTLSAELTYRSGGSGPLFDLRLEPFGFEHSHRLARRFGADRFFEVTMPSPTAKDRPKFVKSDRQGPEKILRWLTQGTHYFLGRTWVPFFTRNKKKKALNKDLWSSDKTYNTYPESVVFFAVNGIHFRNKDGIPAPEEALTPGVRTSMSLSQLLNWAVGLPENTNQPVFKLFTRLSLSLTRSYQTIVLEPDQIRHRERDLGTHKEMNDGIGRLSRSLARKVAGSLGLSDTPSAFQGRLGSAKGMWVIDVQDDGREDWIETYPSQRKWMCDFQDVHHRTFEVKEYPRELKSAALNQQFIPVLETQCQHPMAMRKTIAGYLKAGLRVELDALKAAVDHPMDLRLWMAQSGPSMDGRRRFHGYAPFVGGLPDKEEDVLAFLLDSGFKPKDLKFLMDKVWRMGKRKADLLRTKMNIKVPCSTIALMVADFESVLEEGEVHLSFSTKFQVEGIATEGFSSEPFSDTNLEGFDILVARSPVHLPTDIQKVRVVSKPELRRLKDVIVFSTKGESPLADRLSGGDYDGDKAWVCWDQKIVDNFQNATAVHDCPDLFEEGYLHKNNSVFQELLDEQKAKYTNDTAQAWDSACSEFIHKAFSFNMEQHLLGQCTNYKERYCYKDHPINSEPVFRLSILLSHLVDQAKQGFVFTRDDWDRFRKEILKGPLSYDNPEYRNERSSVMNWAGPKHVLDYLKFGIGEVVIDEALTEFDKVIYEGDPPWDYDLTRLYNEYDKLSTNSDTFRNIMLHLKANIRHLETAWKVEQASSMNREGGSNFTTVVKSIYQRWLDIAPPEKASSKHVARLLEAWSKDRQMTVWELLKASTTFYMCNKRSPSFVWWITGRHLAILKARARPSGPDSSSVLVMPEMWAVLRPDKRLIKAMAANRNAGKDGDSTAALDEVMEFDDDGMMIDF